MTSVQRLTPPLADLLGELGLDPTRSGLHRLPGARSREFLCLPSHSRPQVLVPLTAGGADLVLERRSRTLPAKVLKQLVATGLRSRILPLLPVTRLRVDDPALTELISWLGGEPDSRVGILVGPPRANRKPVLRLLTAAGATTAFAKIGTTPVAAELVRREAAALELVGQAGWSSVRPPRLLRAGEWRDREVVVTSALAGDAEERQPTALPIGPTREIAATGARTDLAIGQTTVLAAGNPLAWGRWGDEIARLGDRLRTTIGDRRIPLGASHGDWTPWNMAWQDQVLEVWDWERYAEAVPQGFDVVHFAASRVRADDPAAAEARFLAELPTSLESCGVDPALADQVLALYLLSTARRYAADLTALPVAAVASRLDWVLRLLRTATDRVELGAVA